MIDDIPTGMFYIAICLQLFPLCSFVSCSKVTFSVCRVQIGLGGVDPFILELSP